MNPLSRKRLEVALSVKPCPYKTKPMYDEKWFLDYQETIQAALSFLLNPEPTDDMLDAWDDVDTRDMLPSKRFKTEFITAISQLTRDE